MSTKIQETIKKKPNIALVFILIAGLILRLYKITFSSIWHDEGYTMWLIRYDFSEIISRTIRDVHPPGYYFFAKLWTAIFGTGVFSIRFLSVLFSLGIIFLTYKIIKEIWNAKAALYSALFVSLSPFMVRFAQEARMYGVVALFTTLATFYFVKYLKEKKSKWLIFYALSMIVSIYTQYYAFFVIISHWLILVLYTKEILKFKWFNLLKKNIGVFDKKWILANLAIFLSYLPWFPVAYKQVTRITGNYWIRPEWITWRTVPNNVLQFASYTHFDAIFNQGLLGKIIYLAVVLLAIFGGFYLFKNKEKAKTALSLYIFGFLPMILVYVLSEIRQPIYQDRYFPFSAVAIFAIWGITVSTINKKTLRVFITLGVCSLFLFGNYVVHQNVNHRMKELVETVKSQKLEGDLITSGELYTFLDSSYYFNYRDIKFLSDPVDGYGETSLFYDQQDKYLIPVDKAQKNNNRIWVIGKTGEKDYYDKEKWQGWESVTYFSEEGKNNGLKAVLFFK